LIIIFSFSILFIFVDKPLFGFTPSDQGKWWRSLNNSEKIIYLTGLKDGFDKFVTDLFPLLEKKGEFNTFYKHMESQSSFFRRMYDINTEVMQKSLSDIYKDPANTYIEPYDALCLAIDKIEGKSIEIDLQRLREFPWKMKKIMEEEK
jgi:hypothetical protein